MKASILVGIAIASSTASATGISDATKVNCAKANANYCIAADIILRCDATAIGIPGRCSDNLAGYPPLGGVASCRESSRDAGDAACEKNCVVYAQTTSYNLPLSQCKPSFTPGLVQRADAAQVVTVTATSVASPSPSGVMSIPEGTSLGTPVTTVIVSSLTTSSSGITATATKTTEVTTTVATTTTVAASTSAHTGGAAAYRAQGALVVGGLVAAYAL